MWYQHIKFPHSYVRTFKDGGLWGFEFYEKFPPMPLRRDVLTDVTHNPKWFESEEEIEKYLKSFGYSKTSKNLYIPGEKK